MAESSIRSGRKKGFVVLFREVAQDGRLSLEARGLFALMASLPENWEYTVSGLAVKAGCGREKVRRLLKELQTVGYLIREQSHGEGGKFGGNVYVLQDEAPPLPENPSNGEEEKPPLPENPVNGENRQRQKPSTGFRPQNNKDLTEEKKNKPPKAPQGGGRRSKYDLEEDAKPILNQYVGKDQELAAAMQDMIANRTELKATNSKRAIRAMLSELDRLSGGSRANKLVLLRRAISSGWKTVYPMRTDELPDRVQAVRGTASPAAPDRVIEEEGTYLL